MAAVTTYWIEARTIMCPVRKIQIALNAMHQKIPWFCKQTRWSRNHEYNPITSLSQLVLDYFWECHELWLSKSPDEWEHLWAVPTASSAMVLKLLAFCIYISPWVDISIRVHNGHNIPVVCVDESLSISISIVGTDKLQNETQSSERTNFFRNWAM